MVSRDILPTELASRVNDENIRAMPGFLREDRERAELDAPLASGIFSKAPSLAQFLAYICDKYFDGQSERIKEYEDSIVRVEAHRIRKRRKQYYENEGLTPPIQIVIPAGQYAPEFLQRNGYRRARNRNPRATRPSPRGLRISGGSPSRSRPFWFWPSFPFGGRNRRPSGTSPLQPLRRSFNRLLCGAEAASIRARPLTGTRDPEIFRTHTTGKFCCTISICSAKPAAAIAELSAHLAALNRTRKESWCSPSFP